MKYLITTQETYRVDDEIEAEALINQAKADNSYFLKKYTSEQKETKDDAYVKVTLIKTFTEEKYPEDQYDVSYTRGSAF